MVPDIDAALKFYRDLLGFRIIRRVLRATVPARGSQVISSTLSWSPATDGASLLSHNLRDSESIRITMPEPLLP
jgi:catechol 2,3-dioxygenase-like lactoylglutathione lyase family enzyme